MPRKAAFLVAIASALASPAALAQQRHSIIVLVDESGTLKRDPGWRNRAAALLAYGLPEGSGLAISGFGNRGRKLELRPLALADTGEGRQNRETLAARSARLGDSDQQTDIYGAVLQSLDQFAGMSPEVRQAAPPILIMLSDFRPDPVGSEQEKSAVCRALQQTKTELVTIGFGSVDRTTMHELTACSNAGLEWGIVSDGPALFNIFWKLEHRLTQQVPLANQAIASDAESFRIGVPKWAQTVLILATSARSGWTWKLPQGALEYEGSGFRLARLSARTPDLNIPISGGAGVRVAAVAFGPLAASLRFMPPKPWLKGETVVVLAQLRSLPQGDLVEQWKAAAAEEASGSWRASDQPVYLAYDTLEQAFKGYWHAVGGTGRLSIDIGGGNWQTDEKSAVSSTAVRFSGLQGDVLSRRAAFEDSGASVQVESLLRGRSFDLALDSDGPLSAEPERLHFGPGQDGVSVRVAPNEAAHLSIAARLASIIKPPPERSSILRAWLVTSTGDRLAAAEPIRIVLTPYEPWQRLGLAFIAIFCAVMLIWTACTGKRFPPWFLVESDIRGKRVTGGRVLALGDHKRSIGLDQMGLPNASLVCTWFGRVSVHRAGDVAFWACGRPLLESQIEKRASVLPGDMLVRKHADGPVVAYVVEKG